MQSLMVSETKTTNAAVMMVWNPVKSAVQWEYGMRECQQGEYCDKNIVDAAQHNKTRYRKELSGVHVRGWSSNRNLAMCVRVCVFCFQSIVAHSFFCLSVIIYDHWGSNSKIFEVWLNHFHRFQQICSFYKLKISTMRVTVISYHLLNQLVIQMQCTLTKACTCPKFSWRTPASPSKRKAMPTPGSCNRSNRLTQTWQCAMTMHDNAWQCMTMHDNAWQCETMQVASHNPFRACQEPSRLFEEPEDLVRTFDWNLRSLRVYLCMARPK